MRKIKRFIVPLVLILFLAGIFSTGCTKYASEEQLKALQDACDAATAAEKRIEVLKTEKAQLEKDLAVKEQELEKFTKDRDAVR